MPKLIELKLTRVECYVMEITCSSCLDFTSASYFVFVSAVITPVSILKSFIRLLFVTLINSFLLLKMEAEDVFSLEVTFRGCIISLITITSSVYSDYIALLILLWCKCLQKLFWYLLNYPTWLDFWYFSTFQYILLFKISLLDSLLFFQVLVGFIYSFCSLPCSH